MIKQLDHFILGATKKRCRILEQGVHLDGLSLSLARTIKRCQVRTIVGVWNSRNGTPTVLSAAALTANSFHPAPNFKHPTLSFSGDQTKYDVGQPPQKQWCSIYIFFIYLLRKQGIDVFMTLMLTWPPMAAGYTWLLLWLNTQYTEKMHEHDV